MAENPSGEFGVPELTDEALKKALKEILEAMPYEWRGTTFENTKLLGREGFSSNLSSLIVKKNSHPTITPITTDDLVGVGNAEDYLRVATNISTTLELSLAKEKNLDISQTFTFASTTMPIISVLLVTKGSVHFYHGDGPAPFSSQQQKVLELLGAKLVLHAEAPPQQLALPEGDVALSSNIVAGDHPPNSLDGLVVANVLYILQPKKIDPAQILVIRKRTATPVTTPEAEAMLQRLAGVPVTALDKLVTTSSGLRGFYDHLQTMSGTEANGECPPAVFVAGLAAIGALWVTMVERGGADVLMCSTAYGGSSQLTDVLSSKAASLKKHTFDIQGTISIVESISNALDSLSSDPDQLQPTTVLFVELPTNPDMKVLDLEKAASFLQKYRQKTHKEVVLMIDTTFAPASYLMERVKQIDPEMSVIVFISMSKSISRGLTTAGTLIANHTPFAQALVHAARANGVLFDTTAKEDQLYFLENNHIGVEGRCERAYHNAVAVGKALCDTVKEKTGEDMRLAFVTPEQAALGIHTSTFSFNLPGLPGATVDQNALVAQRFVDLLTKQRALFKPCVSFGQDNGLVYATVPATSTQGAIKEEDKAKQAVGGVQLVRLSFPPSFDMSGVVATVREAVAALYDDPSL